MPFEPDQRVRVLTEKELLAKGWSWTEIEPESEDEDYEEVLSHPDSQFTISSARLDNYAGQTGVIVRTSTTGVRLYLDVDDEAYTWTELMLAPAVGVIRRGLPDWFG